MTKIIWTDRHGHEFIRPHWRERTLAHHRLLAYAWGMIDDLYADVHIDHISGVGFDNREDNFQVINPDEHLALEAERRVAADGGESYV